MSLANTAAVKQFTSAREIYFANYCPCLNLYKLSFLLFTMSPANTVEIYFDQSAKSRVGSALTLSHTCVSCHLQLLHEVLTPKWSMNTTTMPEQVMFFFLLEPMKASDDVASSSKHT
jgi:hypothetical protein